MRPYLDTEKRNAMSLAPYRPMSTSRETSEVDTPPIPGGLIAILLLLAIVLAIIFLVAAQVVQTP
jgi:hypothetical protein